jgi:hypothetical protein
LAPYNTSLTAFNDILQGSIAQAQINEQLTASANAANAQVISSLITAIGSTMDSAIGVACWVAREVYQGDPRWLVFRAWMLNDAPKWLLRIYLANGERWAQWLRHRPRAKAIVRFFMDGIIYGR